MYDGKVYVYRLYIQSMNDQHLMWSIVTMLQCPVALLVLSGQMSQACYENKIHKIDTYMSVSIFM